MSDNKTMHEMADILNRQRSEALEILFNRIIKQQSQRGVVFRDMTSEEKLQYANQCVLALSVEVGELASSWPFASWKTNAIDIENIEREIVDCIFFLTNISCCFGIAPSDLVKRFEVVIANNESRIKSKVHKEVEY